ncbi:MAG TPA: glycosyltransferase family 39 protein [Patescibacteria group bacterium]|nr:glycosyltransferase family 39 protein [Patescibacteria group bacterium]
MFKKFLINILLSCILILFFILSVGSAMRESLTFDEIVYLQAGRTEVLQHIFTLDPYNPPLIREISMLPYIFNNEFYTNEMFVFNHVLWGRVSIIFLGAALLIAVFVFVKKYLGEKEAIFAIFLLALEPNILANSHYVTIDIGLTLFFFLSYSLFILFLQNPSYRATILLSLSIGLGMATKILFIPYFLLTTALVWFFQYKSKTFSTVMRNWKKLILGGLITLFVIWGIYFFSWHIFIKEREDTSRVSSKVMQFAKHHNLKIVADAIFFLEIQPIPLGDYGAIVKNNVLRGLHSDKCFFLGKYYDTCRWYFMPVNFLLKTPPPLLIYFSVSVFLFIKQRKRSAIQYLLLFPILGTLFSSILFRVQPLVRYILPIFPFIVIFSALSISFWQKTPIRKLIFYILLVWYIAGTLFSFPHFISYANELNFGHKYFLLQDSNLDWGQSLPDARKFMLQHKESLIMFSYFGRDNGDLYGLKSNKSYGSYKNNEICQFHSIHAYGKTQITLISITNWSICGYNMNPRYTKQKIKSVIGESILVF